jgi:hypothetical protein
MVAVAVGEGEDEGSCVGADSVSVAAEVAVSEEEGPKDVFPQRIPEANIYIKTAVAAITTINKMIVDFFIAFTSKLIK